MSLRRRPADAATYIPASTAGGGFSLTKSGALGFSDDIERKLSAPATQRLATATAHPTATPSDAPNGITCNRDVMASLRPYSSYARTNLDMDDEDEMETTMHLGRDMAIRNDKYISEMTKARNVLKQTKGFPGQKKTERIGVEFEIDNAYVRHISQGKYNTVNKFLIAKNTGETQLEIPQEIFRCYQRESDLKLGNPAHPSLLSQDEKAKYVSLYNKLGMQCAEIRAAWNRCNMSYTTYLGLTEQKKKGHLSVHELVLLDAYDNFIKVRTMFLFHVHTITHNTFTLIARRLGLH